MLVAMGSFRVYNKAMDKSDMDIDKTTIDENEIAMNENEMVMNENEMAADENLKKPKYKEIGLAALIVILIAILIGIVIWIILAARLESVDNTDGVNYTVHYYGSSIESYNIEAKDDYIVVKKLEQRVQCIQAPCDPVVVDSFRVDYTDEYRELFEELFEGHDGKFISISASEASSEEKEVLEEIVGER